MGNIVIGLNIIILQPELMAHHYSDFSDYCYTKISHVIWNTVIRSDNDHQFYLIF
jgi:hypothetical protein